MKRTFKAIIIALLCLGFIALGALFIGTHDIAVMNPKGTISQQEKSLFITVALLMLIVVIPVFILTAVIGCRYREGNKEAKYTPNWAHSNLAEAIWWGIPFVIIIILAVITWRTSHELNPFKPIENGKKPVEIQAVALDWKWLFIYPEEGIATVNYVQFPVHTPIDFEITADAPMNSFWIPQLAGQIYAMPAMRTQLHMMATEKGEYRGSTSNISGKGFAGMVFSTHVTSDGEFIEWVEKVKREGKPLGMKEYEELVVPSEYQPASYYVLEEGDLFNRILEKYEPPTPVEAGAK